MSVPPPPSPQPMQESLLERASRPAVLAGWLAQVEAGLAGRPGDMDLARRRAGLLRGLGRLEDAASAYAALPGPQDAAIADLLRGKAGGPARIDGPARFLQVRGILDTRQSQALWDHVADGNALEPARIGQGDDTRLDTVTRRAAMHMDVRPLRRWFLDRVAEVIDREQVFDRLGMAPFIPGQRELQVTRHLDGGFYRIHRDRNSSHESSRTRRLTYVYYFHRHPRRFTGGDLLLCDQDANGRRSAELGFTRLAPLDDSLVFFASDRLHSVTPVSMDGDDPLDGRWTVNGWFHEPETST